MTIDWGNRIINVAKADMLLIQSHPTEIRELDIPAFKAILGDFMDSEAGMAYPAIFNHNPAVSVGGVTLAKVIEIINDYTITFEDGQYAVNLVNANSNVGDRVNVNQVSVRSANSAGLTNIREIQFSSFQGVVALDALNGVSGTIFPTGTHAQPSNNLVDTTFIANLRGIEVIVVHGAFTLNAGDNLHGRKYKGENAITTSMIIDAGTIVDAAQFEDMFIYNSVMNGSTYIKHCYVANTSGISGYVEGSILAQNIGLNNRAYTYFVDCKSACVGLGTLDLPIINMANGVHNTAFRNWAGPIKIINSTEPGNTICFDVVSGANITIDSSCTAGIITVRGIADIVNNGNMTVVVTDVLNSNNIPEVSNAVWSAATRELTVPAGLTATQATTLNEISTNVNAIKTTTTNIQTIVDALPNLPEIRNEFINVNFGRMEIDVIAKQIKFYDKQGVIISIFNTFDDAGIPSVTKVYRREVVQ